MKVFVVRHINYEYVELYTLNTDLTQVDWIKKELECLIPSYQDEYDEFIKDLEELRTRGRVSYATVEERFTVTVEEVIDGSPV